MIIPIRCFTCNKPIAHLWEEYQNDLQLEYNKIVEYNKYQDTIDNEKRESIESKILDKLGLTRYCCRRMFISHIDLCEKI